ncbi:hypothetical protein EDB89DRAFT_1488831 [Lactarius sanguifluus]|nr:hypothetical protein EDB89DRAFT_1488831 [Lactarius sanguifluus]
MIGFPRMAKNGRMAKTPTRSPQATVRGYVCRCAHRHGGLGLALRARWYVGPAMQRMYVGRCATQPARVALQASSFKMHAAIVRFVTEQLRGSSSLPHYPAGLIDNEFPLMHGRISPPLDKLLSPSYADASDGEQGHVAQSVRESDDGTVQLPRTRDDDLSRNRAAVCVDPARSHARGAPPTRRARHGGCVCDGERTGGAWYLHTALLVPVLLAATHQAGSVALLSAVLHVLLALRRSGAAARAWRQANLAREATAKAKVTA